MQNGETVLSECAASFMRTSRLPCFSQYIFMSHLFIPRMCCISSWLTSCQLNVDYKSLHSHLTSVGGTKKTSVGRKESENPTWSFDRPACRPHSCCLISFKQSYYQKSPEFAYRVLQPARRFVTHSRRSLRRDFAPSTLTLSTTEASNR